jgi:hypothetical protein
LVRELAGRLGHSRADRMPNLTIRLDARLKAVPQLSGDLAQIRSQASGPAESPCPAEPVHAEAERRSGPMGTKNES